MGLAKIVIARRWRFPLVLIGLFCVEFPLTVACLTLFGIADPDTYRTKLWQNGYVKGFNSSPAITTLTSAQTPLVWSSYSTQFNIVISVLSMFIMLVKVVMYILHAWIPALSVPVHALLIALYAVSIHNQSAPDLADPDQEAKGLPWMLSKGCSYATSGNYGYCMQARAAFAMTCIMVALFSVYFIYSVYNIIPTTQEKAERLADREAKRELEFELKKYSQSPDGGVQREIFLNLPKTPVTAGFNPMTPRTRAFTQLNGGTVEKGLPFRQQYGGNNDDDDNAPHAR